MDFILNISWCWSCYYCHNKIKIIHELQDLSKRKQLDFDDFFKFKDE